MTGYESKITYASKELTAREKIKLKDLTNALQLDELTQPTPDGEKGNLIIAPDYYVELAIHNEKSDSKDYTKFLIVDKAGTKYVTGSESFTTAFKEIYSEMAEADDLDFEIEVYRVPSKNYKGKDFITCSLV